MYKGVKWGMQRVLFFIYVAPPCQIGTIYQHVLNWCLYFKCALSSFFSPFPHWRFKGELGLFIQEVCGIERYSGHVWKVRDLPGWKFDNCIDAITLVLSHCMAMDSTRLVAFVNRYSFYTADWTLPYCEYRQSSLCRYSVHIQDKSLAWKQRHQPTVKG